LGNPSIEAHEKQGPARGPCNFLLGSAINDAAADHDCASLLGRVVVLNDSNICHSPPSFDAVDVLDVVAYRPIDARAKLHAEGIPHHRIAKFSECTGQDQAAGVANGGTFEEHLIVVKKKMPKRKRKFGKGATRGGNQKSRQSGTVDQLVFAAEGGAAADIQATVSATSVAIKPMNRKQLKSSLDWTTKKLKCAEKNEATTAKKLTAAKALCTVLAKLAQEQQKEGHLAHLQAESKINAIHKETEKKLNVAACEIATAKRMTDDAVSNAQDKIIAKRGIHQDKIIAERAFHLAKANAMAVTTCKQHTKELLLQQEECNILVYDMKSTLKSNQKNHTKSTRIIQHELKDAKSTVLTYANT
jgi:hypothetical protein